MKFDTGLLFKKGLLCKCEFRENRLSVIHTTTKGVMNFYIGRFV